MISKEKEEALSKLNGMVSCFAEENGIEVLMVSAVSKEGEEGLSQISGVVAVGSTENISIALAGSVKTEPKVHRTLVGAIVIAGEDCLKVASRG